MMHFRGFKSKAALKARIASGPPVPFTRYADETSLFGPEYKGDSPTPSDYTVCMDHPARTKFATLTVVNGLVTKAR